MSSEQIEDIKLRLAAYSEKSRQTNIRSRAAAIKLGTALSKFAIAVQKKMVEK